MRAVVCLSRVVAIRAQATARFEAPSSLVTFPARLYSRRAVKANKKRLEDKKRESMRKKERSSRDWD